MKSKLKTIGIITLQGIGFFSLAFINSQLLNSEAFRVLCIMIGDLCIFGLTLDVINKIHKSIKKFRNKNKDLEVKA